MPTFITKSLAYLIFNWAQILQTSLIHYGIYKDTSKWNIKGCSLVKCPQNKLFTSAVRILQLTLNRTFKLSKIALWLFHKRTNQTFWKEHQNTQGERAVGREREREGDRERLGEVVREREMESFTRWLLLRTPLRMAKNLRQFFDILDGIFESLYFGQRLSPLTVIRR